MRIIKSLQIVSNRLHLISNKLFPMITKAEFKKKYPFMFKFLRKLYIILLSTRYPFDYAIFLSHMYFNKPYFGRIMMADITWGSRKGVMQKSLARLINEFDESQVRVLEIGSWAGGSAVLWAQILERQTRSLPTAS